MASQRNRKRRKKLARQWGIPYEHIVRIQSLGYCMVRHQQTQKRFYTQARMIYFALWVYYWLSALSCFHVEYVGVGRVNVGKQVMRGVFDGRQK